MSLILSQEELIQITGAKNKSNQVKQLKALNIPFLINRLGRPVVSRAAFEELFTKADKRNKRPKPDFGAITQ